MYAKDLCTMKLMNTAHAARQAARRGFTLIELLVVMALAAILFTVVFKPLVDSYNLTSRATTQIETQAAGREGLRDISGILSNADYVYDNAQSPINIWMSTFGGAQYAIPTQFAMFEYVPAARQLDQNPYVYDAGSNSYIPTPTDPTTGAPIYDPSLPASLSGFALPLAPGRMLGRVFVGLLRNDSTGAGTPTTAYGNRFENNQLNPATENRYTLYKAEVPVYVQDPTAAAGSTAPYVPNLSLFHTVNASGGQTDSTTDSIKLHDPNFFYDNSLAAGTGSLNWAVRGWKDLNNDGKVQIWENWRAVATSILPPNKVDMVSLTRDDNGAVIYYNGSGNPNASPASGDRPNFRTLATFKPAFLQNDLAVPTNLDNSGQEEGVTIAAKYMTQFDHWSVPFRVMVYRAAGGADPLKQNPYTYYESVGDGRIVAESVNPGAAPPDPSTGTDVGPKSDPSTGVFTVVPQFAFSVDSERGLVNFAFPSTVMVHGAAPAYSPLPQRYSPQDVNLTYDPVNSVERYVDLRQALPTSSWQGSPLNPGGIVPPLSPSNPWYADVRIAPGTERVFGPDQMPGPHYGYRVQYTRVASSNGIVGPNEFKINYANSSNIVGNNPANFLGYMEFRQGVDSGGPESPMNGVYRQAGLPELKYDPGSNQNVPSDAIEVNFNFTMNRPNDVVKVDYLTRNMITILLEARLYDPASGRPQTISLSDRVKVRNLQH